MAEEIAFAVFEILEDWITEEEVAGLASEVLVDGAGEEIAAGASDLLIGGAETWEEAMAADAEAEVVPKELVQVLDSAESSALTAAQKETLFSQARYFAAWVGKEILKGAVLQTALETYQLERKKNVGKPESPDVFYMNLLGQLVEALKVTGAVTKGWRQWAIKNYHQRSDFGMITVEHVVIYRFELFRSALADLDDDLQKLAPMAKQATSGDLDANLGALREGTVSYIKSCQELAGEMSQKDHLMVQKKLEPCENDLQTARKLL